MRTNEITRARAFGRQCARDGASATELHDTAEDAYGYEPDLVRAFWVGVSAALVPGTERAVSTSRNRALRGGMTRGI